MGHQSCWAFTAKPWANSKNTNNRFMSLCLKLNLLKKLGASSIKLPNTIKFSQTFSSPVHLPSVFGNNTIRLLGVVY
jgi:hypothetical protein